MDPVTGGMTKMNEEDLFRALFEAACGSTNLLASIRFIQTGENRELLWKLCETDIPKVHECSNSILNEILRRYGWPQADEPWGLETKGLTGGK